MNTFKTLGVMLVAAGLCAGGNALAADPMALAEKYDCLSCHDVDEEIEGPSFKDIAAEYRGQADAKATLVGVVSAGDPHPEVDASGPELEAIVEWILSL